MYLYRDTYAYCSFIHCFSVTEDLCKQTETSAGRQAGSLARRIAFIFPEWLRWHSESKRKWLFKRRRKTQTASLFCNNQPSFHYDSWRAGGGKKEKKRKKKKIKTTLAAVWAPVWDPSRNQRGVSPSQEPDCLLKMRACSASRRPPAVSALITHRRRRHRRSGPNGCHIASVY